MPTPPPAPGTEQHAPDSPPDVVSDPGHETLCQALWDSPWSEFAIGSYRGLYGTRVQIEVEETIYTPGNDLLGMHDDCMQHGGVGYNGGHVMRMGLGDDLVRCVAGYIYTGAGADVARGVATAPRSTPAPATTAPTATPTAT